MPYVQKPRKRALVIDHDVPRSPGELNFLLTQALVDYVMAHGLEYRTINDCLGALDGAGREFYRRIAAPYEEKKLAENGDVYTRLVNELERLGG